MRALWIFLVAGILLVETCNLCSAAYFTCDFDLVFKDPETPDHTMLLELPEECQHIYAQKDIDAAALYDKMFEESKLFQLLDHQLKLYEQNHNGGNASVRREATEKYRQEVYQKEPMYYTEDEKKKCEVTHSDWLDCMIKWRYTVQETIAREM